MSGQEYYPHSEKSVYLFTTFKWIIKDPSSTNFIGLLSNVRFHFLFFKSEMDLWSMNWDGDPENVSRGRYNW